MNKKKSHMKKKFKITLILALLINLINCQSQQNTDSNNLSKQGEFYKRVYNSTQFYRQFSSELSKITFSQTVNVTHLSNGKQLCIDSLPCQFYYFVIKPKFDAEGINSFSMNGNNYVKNILFVAGMHGNEYLGPLSLLYAIKHLETPSTRIIIFPLANPSGFDHHQRLTFPTNLDPNRDFPIEQYTKCYQTTSSLIIDHIYRKYHIDLTLALHNGKSEIAWNWGTVRQQYNSKTVDEVIYKDIGQWLKFVGGRNKQIQMEQFNIGTMNQVVYPVKGAFEDWAYAASWYNASQGKKPTRQCPFTQYPFNMTNGLVFLFELGPFNVDQKLFGSEEGLYVNPSTKQLSNGYISRAIRIFQGLMKIPNPRLQFKFTNSQIVMNLLGCKVGAVENLRIIDKQNITKIYFQQNEKLQLTGNINNKAIEPKVLYLLKQFYNTQQIEKQKFERLQEKNLIVDYHLVCDPQWQGRGKTIFGQKRQFSIRQGFILSSKSTNYTIQTLFSSLDEALSNSHNFNSNQSQDEQSFFSQLFQDNNETLMVIIILILVSSTVFFIIWIICRDIRKNMKARRIERLKKKLEKINQESSIQEISPYQSSQINLPDIKIMKENKKQTQNKSKKKVESYPQMCESDKSIKTQDLDSFRDSNANI